ncbi:MAG: transposase [Planctomycetes bacterium]|nr:transposase [Planctomycetota bacterium]
MPRRLRQAPGGIAYHVLNRANGRAAIFRRPEDFDAFERVLALAMERHRMRLLTYCLMSNHWHLVLFPREDGDLSRFMQWLTVTHVRRRHAHRRTDGHGHLYQGRFKSFPIQADAHLLTVCRYVERNPLRAGMVKRAEAWRWSGLRRWLENDGEPVKLAQWPVDRARGWLACVNRPQSAPRKRRCGDALYEVSRMAVRHGRQNSGSVGAGVIAAPARKAEKINLTPFSFRRTPS